MNIGFPLLFWPRLKSARMFVMKIYRAILAAQDGDGFLPDFIQLGSSRAPFSCRLPGPPIKALDLIRERHTRRLTGQANLKRIVLDLGGRWTAEQQPGASIVGRRAQHHGGPVSSLLVAGLRVELQPNDITGIRHVFRLHARRSHR